MLFAEERNKLMNLSELNNFASSFLINVSFRLSGPYLGVVQYHHSRVMWKELQRCRRDHRERSAPHGGFPVLSDEKLRCQISHLHQMKSRLLLELLKDLIVNNNASLDCGAGEQCKTYDTCSVISSDYRCFWSKPQTNLR